MDNARDQARKLHRAIWEAYGEEEVSREILFIGEGSFDVAGIKIPAMTGRSFNVLCAINNPYICGGIASTEDACKVIWTVYTQSRKPWWIRIRSMAWQRKRFFKRVDLSSVRSSVRDYLDLIFMDAPRGGEGSANSIAAGIAYMVHTFIKAYGWTESQILDSPLPRLYQYMKIIRETNDPEYKPQAGVKVKNATKDYTNFLNKHGLTHADVFLNN